MGDRRRFNRTFSDHHFRILNPRDVWAYLYRRNSLSDSVTTGNRLLVHGLSDHFVVCDSPSGAGGLFDRRETLRTT